MTEEQTSQSLDLRVLWDVFRRWWWILAAGLLAASLGSFLVSRAQTPVYESRARILVEGAQTPGNPSLGDLQANLQFAQTYADLIMTRPIMEEVQVRLGLPKLPQVTARPQRSFIDITARHSSPQMAASIANTTAVAFIEEVHERQFTQIAQFQLSLGQYGVSQDPNIIATQAARLSNLSVVEEGIVPVTPSSPRIIRNTALGGVLGFLVGAGIMALLAYLDDKVRGTDEVRRITGLSLAGSVLRYRTGKDRQSLSLLNTTGGSPIEEAYKFLRTNLEFLALDSPGGMKVILITSGSPGEGKTTTAANFAVSLAKEGRSVILVDADLRRPSIHRALDLPPRDGGLTQFILGTMQLDEVALPSVVPGLRIITSGPLPPDPAVVLRSERLAVVIKELRAAADVVIIDSPPLLAVTDPLLLTRVADCTLLVVDAQKTGRGMLKRSAELLKQASVGLSGVLLNKVGGGAGYGYYYHYYYYGDRTTKRRRRGGSRSRSKASTTPAAQPVVKGN